MADLASLAACFAGRLLTSDADMAPFLTDWRGLWHGKARAVAQPERPEGAAAILAWCAAHRVPVVPQGGNTGLSGGATPDVSGAALVLSLARLNRIRGLDARNATITADAGCLLATVQAAARQAGLFFPLSLAAEGSCTIGGNLATNAGGTGVLRYGNARSLCLGLEVATASGALWDGLRGLRKDNSGYDLRDLFIGSEGTLGVITGAVLRLFPAPSARVCALLALSAPEQAAAAFGAARDALGERLSGAEFFSRLCLELVLAHQPVLRDPFGVASPWYLLLEASDTDGEPALRARMEALLMRLAEEGVANDILLAQSIAQAASFWGVREAISEAQAAAGPAIKHDIALPLSAVPPFLAEARAAVAAHYPGARFVTFGHIGDGNIHYNFSPATEVSREDFLAWQEGLNSLVHGLVARHGGSISAEHGLGVLRNAEASFYRPPVETEMMRAVKKALDPLGILNPGKLLP